LDLSRSFVLLLLAETPGPSFSGFSICLFVMI
jgi:hypothetical protein